MPDASQPNYVMLETHGLLMASLNGAVAVTTGTVGTPVSGMVKYRALDVLVDVTATGGSTATLTVYIDTKLDGTSWQNLAAGVIMTTASQQVIHLVRPVVTTAMLVNTIAGAGTVRPIGWADDLRVRYTITGATSTFDFRVFINGVG